MRKVLLGATAALALAAPGVANAETSGHVSASYGNTEIDGVGDFDGYGIDGAVATDVGTGWLLQFDANSQNLDGSIGAGGAYVHFGKRGTGHAVAAFVGLTDTFIFSGETIGAEGQLYFSSVTINGSAAFANFDDVNLDVVNLHVDGTFFLNENFGLTGGVSHTQADNTTEVDWTTWSADAAYRLANSGFSVFGGYAYTDSDDLGGEADTWRIGFRFDFGTDTLQAGSQTGASLNGGSNLGSQLRLLL